MSISLISAATVGMALAIGSGGHGSSLGAFDGTVGSRAWRARRVVVPHNEPGRPCSSIAPAVAHPRSSR